ncbi:GDSL-type esterase/lipase family protein [Plantactinospora sp. BB1]|uniref:GDSL-type esterase/lipase family protein n=1 Tax=Plantactinospora sp. BB1 TaxID=2071627 RepID=UPI00131F379C|nr:GDSL-type esterase/lipase family protein [Plantactinospora sp. BB1]
MAGGHPTHGVKGNEVADALAQAINSRAPRLAFLTINEGCLDWLERIETQLPLAYTLRFDPIRGGNGQVANCKHESPFGNAIIYNENILPDPQPVAHDLRALEGAEKREMLCLRSVARTLVVCTAHLVASAENVEQRKREAAEVKRVLATDYAGYHVYLGGDLNDGPLSDALSNLYHSGYGGIQYQEAHGAFKEVFSPCGNEIKVQYIADDAKKYYCRSGNPTHTLNKYDYLFVPPAAVVHSTQLVSSPHSDHKQLWAEVTMTSTAGPLVDSIMVVGDSISQGLEGDYTWRYRLAQHLKAAGRDVTFVGPYRGTTRVPRAQPANYPEESAPPYFNGVYRDGLTFDSDHFAQWGRQAHQAKDDIRARVSQYQPTYLLVELGFNDLGWGVSDPDGLIADMRTLIANARAAKSNIRILVASVPQRTPLDIQPDLGTKISAYNAKLGPALQALNTTTSPVRLVDITTGYDPYADAYDGLHPNPAGEHKIARAFANVLWNQFRVGALYNIPSGSTPSLVPTKPDWIRATSTTSGIRLEWQHSFGAGGYWFYQRNATIGEAFSRLPLQIPADSWGVNWVVPGHRYEFYVVATRGDAYASAPSAVTSATVANLETAAGPPNITATAGTGYIDVSWDAATGPYSETVHKYTVYYLDSSEPGAIVSTKSTTGRSVRLSGLVSGHTYILAVCSVNAAGEGMPAAGPSRTVG